MSETKIELEDAQKVNFRYLDGKLNQLQQEANILTYQKQSFMQYILKDSSVSEGTWQLDTEYNLIKVEVDSEIQK